MKQINHKEACSDDAVCTNGAEGFFSRIRRAEIGIHHHIAGPYLASYANEMAWREDARRIDNVLCREAALGFGQQVSSRRQCADVGIKLIQMVSTVNGIAPSHSKHRIQRH